MGLKSKILGESEKLFLKYGMKSVSMDDIAQCLSVSKKTLYKYIPNKKKLVNQILSILLEKERCECKKIIEKSENAIDEIFMIINHVLKMIRRLNPSFIYDLKKYHLESWALLEDHHNEFIYKATVENIIRGQKEGLYREDVNPSIIAKLHIGNNRCINDEAIFPWQQYKKEELLKQHMRYHLFGIVSEKGIKILNQYEVNND